MSFKIINKETWDRKEYFEHYFSEVPCTYSMTVKLDITKIKNSNKKIYPTMLYFITKVVDNHSEFRTAFNMDGELGVFDEMIPCYTVFNQDTETFTNIWTEYSDDYDVFCKSYEKYIELFSSVKGMIAKPNIPPNHFPVSMIPWTTFEGFNLNLQKGYNYLLPIFTMGKYSEVNGQYLMPLAIQVHHAVCDGFHVCRFVNELQELIEE
ncbi:type A chloramphenicol O-acetyltransferase [Paraclostridium bifermentans]|uniref:type A chloramphenicol O-acetyltransferase n=1 Tax=Paraclostridium bifermentans TaxID=1490 RepID=UPI00115B418B|nr:type A chloramphenicol O-acetyltransferase [Paraclostridium bifermentans]TQO56235.1 type A chloramphenicol O-acetyltransferase [Paraclostridium bifermentans]GKZ02219.1 chloramphenicol acetyltransferase [Paraclostridium bifermentans]GKZ06544.1 chloramphenicol acetyltransferase [Paraclostridium bifermentans]GKZ10746.1 chloramphenicol acetyltransferase [Paraclostridium bifermentans]